MFMQEFAWFCIVMIAHCLHKVAHCLRVLMQYLLIRHGHGQPSLKSWLREEREGVGEEELAAGGEGVFEEGHPRPLCPRLCLPPAPAR